MKSINFKEINLEVGVDTFRVMDLRKVIGNMVFNNAYDIPTYDLSRAIYYSEGPFEMSIDTYDLFMEAVAKARPVMSIIKALKDNTIEIKKEDRNG